MDRSSICQLGILESLKYSENEKQYIAIHNHKDGKLIRANNILVLSKKALKKFLLLSDDKIHTVFLYSK